MGHFGISYKSSPLKTKKQLKTQESYSKGQQKSCAEKFYTARNFVLYRNKQDILMPGCHLSEEAKTIR